MTHQPSFSQAEFADEKEITRREEFLTHMEAVIPWPKLLAVIEPFYPKGERGRPPIGLERRLRVNFLKPWYGRADEALEDALYESQALQGFARFDLAAEGVPDATTLLKFRRLLETHDCANHDERRVDLSLAENVAQTDRAADLCGFDGDREMAEYGGIASLVFCSAGTSHFCM